MPRTPASQRNKSTYGKRTKQLGATGFIYPGAKTPGEYINAYNRAKATLEALERGEVAASPEVRRTLETRLRKRMAWATANLRPRYRSPYYNLWDCSLNVNDATRKPRVAPDRPHPAVLDLFPSIPRIEP